ncbi:TetR/AcrR family transcriptional regulator [Canibacter zhoujuaniae]|uniref:TetR/AcrR family transcriptional regulator n=1 Tax=Canibacter zhoujuaniae TaxID=2708343 RepID=UPI00141E7720|nr:TetR/AcrR family transcriptional regulator [Canibacter zhoujuaniae]
MASAQAHTGRGRPKATNAETLQEAAYDLFLTQGYDSTTIAQITATAGVGRTTFFNYFAEKSDVFWPEIDKTLARLKLALQTHDKTGIDLLIAAVSDTLKPWEAGAIPWILSHFAAIGSPVAALDSSGSRVHEIAALIRTHLVSTPANKNFTAEIAAATLTGALLAAIFEWVQKGPDRGSIHHHLTQRLQPLAHLFDEKIR